MTVSNLTNKVLASSYIPRLCANVNGIWEVKPEFQSLVGEHPIWVNDTFLPYFNHPAKYQIFKGGSGSGKSDFVALNILCKVRTDKFCRVLYLRHQAKDIKPSSYQLFKDLISRYGWDKEFECHESDYRITHKPTGNFMVAGGLDDVEKFKSIVDINICWLEEAVTVTDRIQAKDFRELVRRLRTKRASIHFYITFNPVDKDNYIYEAFGSDRPLYKKYDAETAPRNSFILHTSSYLDNPLFIDPDQLEEFELLKEVNYNEYCIYALGMWGTPKTGNEWIYNFDQEKHVIYREPKPNLFEFSIDANAVPYMSGLVGQLWYDKEQNQQVLSIIDEIPCYPPKNELYTLCEKLIDKYLKPFRQTLNWTADSATRSRVPGFGNLKNKNVYYEIKETLKPYVHNTSDKCALMPKNPSKSIARDGLNNIFAGLSPDRKKKARFRIEISPHCELTIKDLRELQVGVDGYDPQRINENGMTFEKLGHFYSTLVYMAYYICPEYFKSRRLRTPNMPSNDYSQR